MKTKKDFNKWEETHEFEFHYMSQSSSWTTHITPNGSRIQEIMIQGSLLKPVTSYFTVCYALPKEKFYEDLIKDNRGKVREHPYCEGEKILAEFEELEYAWLFMENNREIIERSLRKELKNGKIRK